MIFKYFDSTDAHNFGESLADFFTDRIPNAAGNKTIDATILGRQYQALDEIYLKIDQFKLNNSLNVFKKAKLGTAFKNKLIAAGYDPKLVEILTKGIITKL